MENDVSAGRRFHDGEQLKAAGGNHWSEFKHFLIFFASIPHANNISMKDVLIEIESQTQTSIGNYV